MAKTPDRMQHLDADKLSRLKSQLEAEQKRLKAEIAEAHDGGAVDMSVEPLLKEPEDFAEMAQDITTEETEQAITANELGILDQIEKALHRMQEGVYGLSEVTGRPIPYERLKALPWATTNVDDQRQ
jgi:DnaK suppressor protein